MTPTEVNRFNELYQRHLRTGTGHTNYAFLKNGDLYPPHQGRMVDFIKNESGFLADEG